MANKMTQKHIGFSESIVMRELEKIVVDKKLIKLEEQPRIEVKASTKLEVSGDVFLDAISLASVLRERGFVKQAALLEKSAIEYKKEYKEPEENKYDWWKEEGKDLLEHAHEIDFQEPVASSNDYGVVEDLLQAQKKIVDTVGKIPTGKLSNAERQLIFEINKVAAEPATAEPAESAPEYLEPNDADKQNITALINIAHGLIYKYDKSVGALKSLPKPAFKIDNSNINNISQIAMNLKVAITDPQLSNINLLFKEKDKIAKIQQICNQLSGLKQINELENFDWQDIYALLKSLFPNESLPTAPGAASQDNRQSALTAFVNAVMGKINKINNDYKTIFNNLAVAAQNRNSEYDKTVNTLQKYHVASDNLRKTMKSIEGLEGAISDNDQANITRDLNTMHANFNKLIEIKNTNVLPFVQYLDFVFPSQANVYNALIVTVNNNYAAFIKEKPQMEAMIKKLSGLMNVTLKVINKQIPNFSGWKNNLATMQTEIAAIVNNQENNVKNPQDYATAKQIKKIVDQMNAVSNKINDNSSFGDLVGALRRVPGTDDVDVPSDPKQFLSSTSKSLNAIREMKKRFDITTAGTNYEYIKKEGSIADMARGGGGDGAGGAAPTSAPAKSQTRGGGGSATSADSKSDKTKGNIAAMQTMQGEFATFAKASSIKTNLDPSIASAINTAKDGLMGANSDGVWGNNTQKSLETIQKYIDSNPDLNTRINNKIHAEKPRQSDDENEINKNINNNIVVIAQASALLGDSKYAKFLPQIIKSGGFDIIPKNYRKPNAGDERSYNSVPDGIRLSERELSSLGMLKKHLDNNSFSVAEATISK